MQRLGDKANDRHPKGKIRVNFAKKEQNASQNIKSEGKFAKR